MKQDLLILEADKEFARKRIEELEAEIMALGPEFRSAFTQTSETWHDNAPFEAVRDHQNMLSTELQNLKHILRNSLPSIPRQKKNVVGIGSRVTVKNLKNNHETTYLIAGDWTHRAGHKENGAIIMSCKSPLALTILDKKAGDEVSFNVPLVIVSIEN